MDATSDAAGRTAIGSALIVIELALGLQLAIRNCRARPGVVPGDKQHEESWPIQREAIHVMEPFEGK